MELHATDIKFEIGARRLLTVRRQLLVHSWTIDHLLGHEVAPEIQTCPDADGLRLLSYPQNRLDEIAAEFPQYIAGEAATYPRHFIDMRGDFAAYLAEFSPKTRSTLARKSRKIAKLQQAAGNHDDADQVAICRYHKPDQLDTFFAEAVKLSDKTYQAKLMDGGLPNDPGFIDQAKQLAAMGNLRAYLLFIGDRAVSYLYLPIYHNIIKYEFLGYHPDYRKYSVGTVLQMAVLEELFAEERFRYFDFTEGDGPHKALFGRQSVDAATLILLKRQPANQMLLGAHRAFIKVTGQLSTLADNAGVKPKLRRLIRAQP